MSAIVTLKKGEGRTIKAGGMWMFDNEIDTVTGTFENGEVVLVHDFDGYPMGRGFINSQFQDPCPDADEKDRSGDRPCIFADARAECVGLPQDDSGYLFLPRDFRGGGFPAGTGCR